MFVGFKSLVLSTLLAVSTSVSAMAQTAPLPSTQTTPHGSIGTWLSGHPLTDGVVVLAIIVVIAGTYFMRRRSRA